MQREFSHLDEAGNARMVDIGQKEFSKRIAIAQSVISMEEATLQKITSLQVPKGDVLSCARIAGIMAAKKTSDLIPMCHPLPLEKVSIEFEFLNELQIRILATTECTYKTGVEMEALTAVTTAALTIYDMCKAMDRSMRIDEVMLLYKHGGKSGTFSREEPSL